MHELLYFVVRVRYRREESSRSLSRSADEFLVVILSPPANCRPPEAYHTGVYMRLYASLF